MTNSIGFIGLGVMGAEMAKHLIKNGNKLNVISRDSKKTKKFISEFKSSSNLKIFTNLKDLSRNSKIIITCVGNDIDLKKIYFAKDGILENVNKNTIIIDHTTASVKISEDLFSSFLKKKCFFYDAPVSGGEDGAKKGALSIMVGGEKRKIGKIKSVLDPYTKSFIHMGKSGNGQLTKMVNQICVATIIQGLAEGLFFAKKKKLNINKLLDVISNGAAQSWQLENRAKTMWNMRFNFGFMNKLMLKDLKLISEELSKSNIKLPVTKKIMNYYDILVQSGYDKEDTSNLIRLLK